MRIWNGMDGGIFGDRSFTHLGARVDADIFAAADDADDGGFCGEDFTFLRMLLILSHYILSTV